MKKTCSTYVIVPCKRRVLLMSVSPSFCFRFDFFLTQYLWILDRKLQKLLIMSSLVDGLKRRLSTQKPRSAQTSGVINTPKRAGIHRPSPQSAQPAIVSSKPNTVEHAKMHHKPHRSAQPAQPATVSVKTNTPKDVRMHHQPHRSTQSATVFGETNTPKLVTTIKRCLSTRKPPSAQTPDKKNTPNDDGTHHPAQQLPQPATVSSKPNTAKHAEMHHKPHQSTQAATSDGEQSRASTPSKSEAVKPTSAFEALEQFGALDPLRAVVDYTDVASKPINATHNVKTQRRSKVL